jgi:Arm DNA-binding domain
MARVVGKLTALKMARLAGPGMYADGGGRCLQVSGTGAKSWIFRYSLHRKAREMGFGSVATIGLSDARTKPAECRRLCHDGVDPIDARRAANQQAALDAAKTLTFKDAASAFIGSHSAGWRNAKHAAQWKVLARHTPNRCSDALRDAAR